MRDGALQLCPESGIVSTTPARSLGKARVVEDDVGTLVAEFLGPPLTVGAAFVATSTPARLRPVNDTMSMRGARQRGADAGARPLTRSSTPAGTPPHQDLGEDAGREQRHLERFQTRRPRR